MRTVSQTEMDQVSGGCSGWNWSSWSKKSSCGTKSYSGCGDRKYNSCNPAPKCDPKPVCNPKPVCGVVDDEILPTE